MCANSFGKRLILFSAAFALGVLSVNFFASGNPAEQKLRRDAEIERKFVSNEIKIRPSHAKNCFPVETDSEKPFISETLNEEFAALMKLKRKLQNRLRTNPNMPEKEKTTLERRLEVVEKQILSFKDSNKDFAADKNGTSRKLLYVEECYEF